MKHAFRYFFILVAMLHLLAIAEGWPQIEFATKPLILLTLIAYYSATAVSRSYLFIAALSFCLLGDIFLLFQDQNPLFFMGGLGSFLVGHIFFILSYRQMRNAGSGLTFPQMAALSLFIIALGVGLVLVLLPGLGSLSVPVILYASVLTLMVLQALYRYGHTGLWSFELVMGGALCFMASDSLLALNKFYHPFADAGLAIMFTYCFAQFLIVEGALAHSSPVTSKA